MLCRIIGSRQKIGEVIVYAGNAEVWLFLERARDVVHGVVGSVELDDGQDKVVRLVQ